MKGIWKKADKTSCSLGRCGWKTSQRIIINVRKFAFEEKDLQIKSKRERTRPYQTLVVYKSSGGTNLR